MHKYNFQFILSCLELIYSIVFIFGLYHFDGNENIYIFLSNDLLAYLLNLSWMSLIRIWLKLNEIIVTLYKS
jgi:hypothetical protein